MPFSTLIRNGRVVLPGLGVQEIDLAVQDGRISGHPVSLAVAGRTHID